MYKCSFCHKSVGHNGYLCEGLVCRKLLLESLAKAYQAEGFQIDMALDEATNIILIAMT